ncbi:hypothetical protein T439DRAFT_311710 [Meredithblackwellia eburnea MCA 4105]
MASHTSATSKPGPRLQKRGVSRRERLAEEDNQDEEPNERTWLLRPGRERVEWWLESWWRRWAVLVAIPCLVVWLWAAMPFPVSDPYVEEPPWHLPWPEGEEDLPVDANFYFFLCVYYGIYLAWALIFVTKLFDLYRLNWWPQTLGGSFSYFLFWALPLLLGYTLHYFQLDGRGTRRRTGESDPNRSRFDWERKTTWVALAFVTMTLPAIACFSKLRRDRRQTFRRSLTPAQKTFLERQLSSRMPRSYKRFLWFMLTLGLSLFALVLGQGFATVYLSTLPHSNLDGVVYVWTWILTIQCLNAISNWVLQRKVRSRALVFVFRFYYFLAYFIFYRNLFARLRSPDQALYIQLLSSSWVVVWYPLSMSRTFHRFLCWAVAFDRDWEEYSENVATMLYLRNLSENVTMVAFLGWLTILHFGPNKQLYPFFSFESDTDPYNYRLTAVASLIIWASELVSSFLARLVIWFCYRLDVTNIGLDHFRDHPELVVACAWASIHVLSDILLFLIKLNFRYFCFLVPCLCKLTSFLLISDDLRTKRPSFAFLQYQPCMLLCQPQIPPSSQLPLPECFA